MPITDYNKKKNLEVTTQNDSGTTQDKAQPVLVTAGETTFVGDVGNTNNVTFVNSNSFDVVVNTRGILSSIPINVRVDRNVDYNLEIRDSSSNVLASESGSSSQNFTVNFSQSDYSRIPEAETITVFVEETNNQNYFIRYDGPSVSTDAFSINSSESYVLDSDITFLEILTDSTTGTGDIIVDWTNIDTSSKAAAREDIALYDQNGNLLDYEIESLDTTAETAVLWAYNSWTRDDSVQAQIAYGDNSANTDRQNVTGTWNNTGQNTYAAYHLDETSGQTLDSSSNDNDSINTKGTTFDVSGQFNGARDGDGNDDFVSIPSLPSGTSSYTVIAWVNHDTINGSANQHLIRGSSPIMRQAGGVNADNQYQFFHFDGGFQTIEGVTSLSTDKWFQIALKWDGSTVEAFVDASSEGNVSSNSFSDEGRTHQIFANGSGGGNLDGTIDAVRIFVNQTDGSASVSQDWIQADYDASPKGGQVYFSQQAAEQTVTDQTASIPVTQNTQTTPDPQVQAGTVTVSTPTTLLTQTTINPEVQPGTAPLNIQETQLTASNPDITLEPGVSRIQVSPTALIQTTENPAVNAIFDVSIPETQLTATNSEPTLTVGSTILAPETQLTQTTPNIQVTPGGSLVTVPETQLTVTNPEIGLNRRIVFGVVTQLNTENPEPNLEPGIVQLNVTETQLVQTTEDPQVVPGEAQIQVTPPTDLTVFTPNFVLTPGPTDLKVDETQLIQTTPEPSIGLDLQFVSPTNALITNKNRYFDMADHTFKQNDFGDTFTATLKDDDNPEGVSIKGNTGVKLVVETFDGEKVLDKEMKVTDADNGKVEYSWQTGDFIEDTGVYRAEIKVFDSTDEPETFPNNGYRSVTVEDEIE